MYTFAIIVQVLAAIICFASVLITATKKTGSYSNIIIITFVCGFIQNAAYIMELTAKNTFEAMTAVRAEYLGGAFEICLMTFFMFKYCGHEIWNSLKCVFILEGILVLFSVWTWEFNPMYYTNVDFVSDAVIPHLVLSHGWLYFTFAITTVIELLACMFILIVSLLKTNQNHMKRNYYILISVVSVPLILYIGGVTGVFGGFDSTPLGAAIAIGIFSFSLARNHVFDVADAAGTLILSELENALIVVNNENGYEYSNNKAKELFPVLKTYKRSAIITERDVLKLFDDEKKDSIQIGDRLFAIGVNTVCDHNEPVGKTIVLFDVTESKKQMEKMRELVEEAERANDSKSLFMANVSHEIRTPINVIMGMSEVLLREFPDPETEEYYLNIRHSSSTLLNLINDILDFSKIESGKMEIIDGRFDVKKVLSELISVYNFRCGEKNLAFEYEVDGEIPRFVTGDVVRIKQIFNNLLTNAVKYTEEGKVKMKVAYKRRNDFDIDLIMSVEDTGIGIRKEDMDKLYEGFVRVDQRRTNTIEGTGLGLTITKQLVELMGGIINFKSEYGKGSVFSVIFPLSVAEEDTETCGNIKGVLNDEKVYRTSYRAPEAKVLVVDDSKTNLIVFEKLIKHTEVQVTTALSGEKCLELIKDTHFDMIFMDHRMPVMDGVETFSRIQQFSHKCENTPVIMLTANVSSESRSLYIEKGFNDFLSKPVGSEQLIKMMYKYLPENLIEIIE